VNVRNAKPYKPTVGRSVDDAPGTLRRNRIRSRCGKRIHRVVKAAYLCDFYEVSDSFSRHMRIKTLTSRVIWNVLRKYRLPAFRFSIIIPAGPSYAEKLAVSGIAFI